MNPFFKWPTAPEWRWIRMSNSKPNNTCNIHGVILWCIIRVCVLKPTRPEDDGRVAGRLLLLLLRTRKDSSRREKKKGWHPPTFMRRRRGVGLDLPFLYSSFNRSARAHIVLLLLIFQEIRKQKSYFLFFKSIAANGVFHHAGMSTFHPARGVPQNSIGIFIVLYAAVKLLESIILLRDWQEHSLAVTKTLHLVDA